MDLSIDMEKPGTAIVNAKILGEGGGRGGSLLGKVESERGLVLGRD